MGLLLWAGGLRVIDGQMTVGTLTEFLTFMTILQAPVRQLGMVVNSFARTSTCGARLFAVLDLEPTISDRADAPALDIGDGTVRFEDVSFAYAGEGAPPVLRATTPDLVVVPRADSENFLVAVGATGLSLYSDHAVKLDYAEWSGEDVVRRVAEEAGAASSRWVVLLVPHDAEVACRQRCDALLAQLVQRGHASWAVVRRTTRAASAGELIGPAALEEALPRIAAEPYEDPHRLRDR